MVTALTLLGGGMLSSYLLFTIDTFLLKAFFTDHIIFFYQKITNKTEESYSDRFPITPKGNIEKILRDNEIDFFGVEDIEILTGIKRDKINIKRLENLFWKASDYETYFAKLKNMNYNEILMNKNSKPPEVVKNLKSLNKVLDDLLPRIGHSWIHPFYGGANKLDELWLGYVQSILEGKEKKESISILLGNNQIKEYLQ